MSPSGNVRLVGMNHVAFEVADLEEALDWYESLFAFEYRGRSDTKAFLDMGDQFLALAETDDAADRAEPDWHVGIVVDDVDALKQRLDELGIEPLPTSGLDIRDPSGNRLQIVAYEDVQFTKAGHVLDGMGLSGLGKSDAALAELAEKGLAPR